MLKKRLLWTAVIVLAVAGAVTGHVDKASEEQAENALKNALVTFAVARTLNGVISVAQGTEVALEPGAVGVSRGTPGSRSCACSVNVIAKDASPEPKSIRSKRPSTTSKGLRRCSGSH
jgi:hypothetical protein